MKNNLKNNLTNNPKNIVRAALIAALAAALSAAASSSFAAGAGARTEHVTYTYDVPWDAVHRYPPALRPYEYAQGCHSQQQSVPRHGGGTQTVNIVRCY
jgi:hypothetical protein